MQTAESQYQKLIEEEVAKACRLFTALAASLFPAFSLLDYLTQEAHYPELWAIRFSTTLLYCALYFLTRKGRFLGRPVSFGFFALGIAAFSITGMCLVLDGYRSPYYAGVNLAILSAGLIFPWGARKMAIAVGMILSIYAGAVLIDAGFSLSAPELLINNLYFMGATGIIGIASAHHTARLKRQVFVRLMEVERSRAELKRANEVKTRFFANVSHELRTPLTLILGPIQQLKRSLSLPESARTSLDVVERNARVLLKHVNDLLEVARLDAAKAQLSYSRVDLSELVRRVASQFEILARQRGMTIAVEVPEQCPAEVDAEKIERILMNLLSNAFKFTPDSGLVRASLCLEGSEVALCVSDSGPGISPQLRQRIFDRFFQAEESITRRHGGIGLGLAIVKEFTALHQGAIEVRDCDDGGASFRVRLPSRAPERTEVRAWNPNAPQEPEFPLDIQTQAPDPAQVSAPDQPPAGPATWPLVLVVEDHLDMNSFLCGTLSQRFRVAQAFDGREGLIKACALRPDLIISDIMMPEVSGVDLLGEIRAQSELSGTPIVMLTAKADEELRTRLLNLGVQDYLLKPFSADELLARVSNHVAVKRTRDLLQAELKSKHADLEALVRELSDRKQALEEAMGAASAARDEARDALKLREEFISIASHELKTPLTSMKLQTQLVARILTKSSGNVERAQVNQLIQRYETQINRLNRLVEEMLDFSAVSAGKLEIKPESTDLMQVVRAALDQLSEGFRTEKIEITLKGPEEAPGEWDPFRLEQVFTNLLTNAIKYGDQKPIEIAVSVEGDDAVVQVRDQGSGIPENAQTKIFGQFERAVSSMNISGLGLGLYICKNIVERHQGSITVQSELGKGSVFTVRLPRQRLPLELTLCAQAATHASPRASQVISS